MESGLVSRHQNTSSRVVQTPQPFLQLDKKDFDLLTNFKLKKDVNEPMEANQMRQVDSNKQYANAVQNINIGIRAFDKKGEFKPVRSKYLMVKAWPEYNKWQLLDKAVKKHTNHDRFFTLSSDEWTFIHPDGVELLSIPGKDDVLKKNRRI